MVPEESLSPIENYQLTPIAKFESLSGFVPVRVTADCARFVMPLRDLLRELDPDSDEPESVCRALARRRIWRGAQFTLERAD